MTENGGDNPLSWEIRLQGMFDSMGSAERRVAEYFRAQRFEVLEKSIAVIAKEAGASEATVVRFCRDAGYKGLKDFKIALAMDQVSSMGEEHEPVFWGDDMQAVRNKVFTDSTNALKESVMLLNPSELSRAAHALYNSKHINLVGLGGSVPIILYMRHQLMKIGIRSNVYTDAQTMHLSLSQYSNEDVVLAISSSGETKEIVRLMRWAGSQGAETICVTNHPESTLAQAVDIVLVTTGSPFFFGGKNTLSRFAQLAVVNVLYLGIALEMGESTVEEIHAKNKEARGMLEGKG